jgi:hypothetical protein
MATTTVGKTKGGVGVALLVLAVAIALASGAGHMRVGGGAQSAGALSGAGDPCRGRPDHKVIRTWEGAFLNCKQWRHILDRHRLPVGATARDVLACIDNVLTNGRDIGNSGKLTTRWGWKYKYGWAYVILDPGGLIVTAYTQLGIGKVKGNDWIKYAEG